MDRTQEIALAKSVAPDSIAKDATVLVLTRTGYETAVKGTNGFVCYVGRGIVGAPRIKTALRTKEIPALKA